MSEAKQSCGKCGSEMDEYRSRALLPDGALQIQH